MNHTLGLKYLIISRVFITISFACSIFLTPVCLAMLYSTHGDEAQIISQYFTGYFLYFHCSISRQSLEDDCKSSSQFMSAPFKSNDTTSHLRADATVPTLPVPENNSSNFIILFEKKILWNLNQWVWKLPHPFQSCNTQEFEPLAFWFFLRSAFSDTAVAWFQKFLQVCRFF